MYTLLYEIFIWNIKNINRNNLIKRDRQVYQVYQTHNIFSVDETDLVDAVEMSRCQCRDTTRSTHPGRFLIASTHITSAPVGRFRRLKKHVSPWRARLPHRRSDKGAQTTRRQLQNNGRRTFFDQGHAADFSSHYHLMRTHTRTHRRRRTETIEKLN